MLRGLFHFKRSQEFSYSFSDLFMQPYNFDLKDHDIQYVIHGYVLGPNTTIYPHNSILYDIEMYMFYNQMLTTLSCIYLHNVTLNAKTHSIKSNPKIPGGQKRIISVCFFGSWKMKQIKCYSFFRLQTLI